MDQVQGTLAPEPKTRRMVNRIGAIKEFFSVEGKPVDIHELKKLTGQDKDEMAKACANAINADLSAE